MFLYQKKKNYFIEKSFYLKFVKQTKIRCRIKFESLKLLLLFKLKLIKPKPIKFFFL